MKQLIFIHKVKRETIFALAIHLTIFLNSLIYCQPLSTAYHNNDEIRAELEGFKQNYPQWVALDTIGYSAFYRQPILMIKISDHPNETEAEPAVLFIGQLHAEEVLGVEITIELAKLLLEGINYDTSLTRLEETEIYIIPTLNPDGLDVVHRGLDITFRKNCRDNIGDGRLRYVPDVGRDTSGVDINRNFALHWNRGDTLFQVRNGEYYNYYRGASPCSEPETQALCNLMLSRRFLICISYHSSRSGQNAETVIAPWNWDGRRPPNATVIDAVGSTIASLLPKQAGGINYSYVRTLQRVGQLPDWAYQSIGTLTYMVEIGANIQPDSSTMRQVVASSIPSALFLIDLACNRERIANLGHLTIITSERENSHPISMQVLINGVLDPILEPRFTHTLTGRFDAFLTPGNYNLTLKKNGFNNLIIQDIEIANGEQHIVYANITAVPYYRVRFEIREAGSDSILSAYMKLLSSDGLTCFNIHLDQGQNEYQLPADRYRMYLISPGYLPVVDTLVVNQDRYTFEMQQSDIVYDEDFEFDRNWQRGGWGEKWGIENVEGRSCITESIDSEYLYSTVIWLLLETSIEFLSNYDYIFEIIHQPYFEPGSDFAYVEFYQHKTQRWLTAASFSQFPKGWDTVFVSLKDYDLSGGPILIRLKVSTDEAVNENGWLVDRIRLYRTTSPSEIKPDLPPISSKIEFLAFPNPANDGFKILFKSELILFGDFKLWNDSGQLIYEFKDRNISPGEYLFDFKSHYLPSGRYYAQFIGYNISMIKPITIIR